MPEGLARALQTGQLWPLSPYPGKDKMPNPWKTGLQLPFPHTYLFSPWTLALIDSQARCFVYGDRGQWPWPLHLPCLRGTRAVGCWGIGMGAVIRKDHILSSWGLRAWEMKGQGWEDRQRDGGGMQGIQNEG